MSAPESGGHSPGLDGESGVRGLGGWALFRVNLCLSDTLMSAIGCWTDFTLIQTLSTLDVEICPDWTSSTLGAATRRGIVFMWTRGTVTDARGPRTTAGRSTWTRGGTGGRGQTQALAIGPWGTRDTRTRDTCAARRVFVRSTWTRVGASRVRLAGVRSDVATGTSACAPGQRKTWSIAIRSGGTRSTVNVVAIISPRTDMTKGTTLYTQMKTVTADTVNAGHCGMLWTLDGRQ